MGFWTTGEGPGQFQGWTPQTERDDGQAESQPDVGMLWAGIFLVPPYACVRAALTLVEAPRPPDAKASGGFSVSGGRPAARGARFEIG